MSETTKNCCRKSVYCLQIVKIDVVVLPEKMVSCVRIVNKYYSPKILRSLSTVFKCISGCQYCCCEDCEIVKFDTDSSSETLISASFYLSFWQLSQIVRTTILPLCDSCQSVSVKFGTYCDSCHLIVQRVKQNAKLVLWACIVFLSGNCQIWHWQLVVLEVVAKYLYQLYFTYVRTILLLCDSCQRVSVKLWRILWQLSPNSTRVKQNAFHRSIKCTFYLDLCLVCFDWCVSIVIC